MYLTEAIPTTWFTVAGAAGKERRMIRQGLPSFKNWRFFTLTLADREVSPLEAYQVGHEKMQRFLFALRRALGYTFKCAKPRNAFGGRENAILFVRFCA